MDSTRPYYEHGGIAIYHGDCWVTLSRLGGTADVIITDPPYDKQTHEGARTTRKEADGGNRVCIHGIDFEPITDPAEVARLLIVHARRWVIAFCALEQLGAYRAGAEVNGAWVRSGVWHRLAGAPQFSGDRPAQGAEGIAIMHAPHAGERMRWNGHGSAAVWAAPVVHSSVRVHPTEKPLSLISSLVADFSEPGELIVDPFCGSGTTLVAARNHGRRAIGIEQDERYCEMAARKLAQGVLL